MADGHFIQALINVQGFLPQKNCHIRVGPRCHVSSTCLRLWYSSIDSTRFSPVLCDSPGVPKCLRSASQHLHSYPGGGQLLNQASYPKTIPLVADPFLRVLIVGRQTKKQVTIISFDTRDSRVVPKPAQMLLRVIFSTMERSQS